MIPCPEPGIVHTKKKHINVSPVYVLPIIIEDVEDILRTSVKGFTLLSMSTTQLCASGSTVSLTAD